uniref:Uncharacterized protein n=1 Tax=Cacopsylla melanoneura TaxID=428564 RepID=A0A8D9AQ17_9HEMI
MLGVYGMAFVGLIAIFPYLPKLLFSQSQLDNLQRIYKLKHPHNALPAHIYIPWIDPSDPKYYAWLYLEQIYMAIVLFVRIFLCLGFLLSGYCLQVPSDILISYTKLLGTVHTNSKGKQIFHTSIEKGEHIEVDPLPGSGNTLGPEPKAMKRQYRQLCWEYDYYFFKQIVQYHQKLRYMTREVN